MCVPTDRAVDNDDVTKELPAVDGELPEPESLTFRVVSSVEPSRIRMALAPVKGMAYPPLMVELAVALIVIGVP